MTIDQAERLISAMMGKSKMKDVYCPVCGYYCLGKGGFGCIDKPFLVGLKDDSNFSPSDSQGRMSYEVMDFMIKEFPDMFIKYLQNIWANPSRELQGYVF